MRVFHLQVCNVPCTFFSPRYYAIATPSATQRLLLGLLEAPPSWAPDALDAAVQLVELLRAAEYASGMRVRRILILLEMIRFCSKKNGMLLLLLMTMHMLAGSTP